MIAGETPVLVHNCNVDYFDPNHDLLNAVHNQRIADNNSGNLYAAITYRDGNKIRTAVAHSDSVGHAEEHLLNLYGKGNIIEMYSEFQPCSGRKNCWAATDGIKRSWTWDWTVSAAGGSAQKERKDAMKILFELARM